MIALLLAAVIVCGFQIPPALRHDRRIRNGL